MTMYPTPASAIQSIGFVAVIFALIFTGRRLSERVLKLAWFGWAIFCVGWYIFYYPNYQ